MPNQPKTPLIAVRVPEEVQRRLRERAEKEGKSLSDVVREAIDRHLNEG